MVEAGQASKTMRYSERGSVNIFAKADQSIISSKSHFWKYQNAKTQTSKFQPRMLEKLSWMKLEK